jgi:predicted ATPase
MRIAFTGSHRVGKTTLLEAVADALPEYTTIGEPYEQLEEDGYEHADPPSLADFEAQLDRAITSLEESDRDGLFDRCPVDVLAYLLVHEDASDVEPDAWSHRVREAMSTVDLIVFVPIEQPDRIAVPSHESKHYRQRVHEQLEQLLVDAPDELDSELLIVRGNLQSRLESVLRRVRAGA